MLTGNQKKGKFFVLHGDPMVRKFAISQMIEISLHTYLWLYVLYYVA